MPKFHEVPKWPISLSFPVTMKQVYRKQADFSVSVLPWASSVSLCVCLCRSRLSMEITSGLRRMCLETTVMWENNTVLPEHWLVSLLFLSSLSFLSLFVFSTTLFYTSYIPMQLFCFRKVCEGKASYSHWLYFLSVYQTECLYARMFTSHACLHIYICSMFMTNIFPSHIPSVSAPTKQLKYTWMTLLIQIMKQ